MPRGDLWMLNTPSRIKLALSADTVLRKSNSSALCGCRSHSQNCIIEDNRLERDVPSASGGMVFKYLRGPSVGIARILASPRLSERDLLREWWYGFQVSSWTVSWDTPNSRSSTALVPQQQLWYLEWLMSVQSVGDRHSREP